MKKTLRKPNLFIVGEPRSGTTALYNYLKEHPQIYFPKPKEPSHFATYFFEEYERIHKPREPLRFKSKENYLKLYEGRDEQYLGDASTKYLYSKEAAARIHKFNPDAKILAIFREPIDFLCSYHSRQLFLLNESEKNLIKALKLEKYRKKGKKLPEQVKTPSSLLYSKRLQYSEHIKRYLNHFPTDQIKIIIFEDFKRDNLKILSEIYEFLNLKREHIPKLRIYNKNKIVRSRKLIRIKENPLFNSLLQKLFPHNLYIFVKKMMDQVAIEDKPSQPLNTKLKSYLKAKFRNNVKELNQILKYNNLIDQNLLKKWGY